ncbi:mRNA-decapping enzyme 1B-like [Archocentrus centrarchus]|uniref:mRNA-decapping enzyme 1B-like n=1 Tax=Archocentrus centrarchus TaxID=63155 RepID=UPI0011E9DA4E|nr:mRNA-decapping enzyme 1B-like [Archocentrus centrarchus]
MNRLSMENLTERITKDLDFQLQDPFLLYRTARYEETPGGPSMFRGIITKLASVPIGLFNFVSLCISNPLVFFPVVIHGIWFYDKEDCRRIAQGMKTLTQQEQVLAQSHGGWLSRGGVGGGGEGEVKGVDIIQMLTKARTEYDKEKSTSEPKEIGGRGVLSGNPNLIKPIPVKPNTQDNEGAEPKPLSLATLFGSQHQHRSSKPDSVPLVNASPMGSSTGNESRPPVARTLTYDDTVNSGRNVASDGGIKAVVGQDGGNAVSGLLQSPTNSHQLQPNQPQHCPAIAKLMQGQRGVGSVGGVLQTVSESPENRLCDNGVLLEHHPHHHHLYHHQQPHHHHPHQLQPDPIKRLFQTQPPPPPTTSFSSAAPKCCSNPHLSSQPVLVDSASCAHLQAQQSQQLFFSLSNSQPEMQNSQTASTAQGTGLSQMPGMVSPHELLQKLQLVPQEQSLASNLLPRICPGLAPRFLGPAQSQGAGSALATVPNPTAGTAAHKAALQLQRIPATVAPTLLLSPSVFIQTKSSSGLSAVGQESCHTPLTVPRPPLQEEARILSRSQLQATLLHLIQTDSSFLDSIYEAYVSRFAKDSSSKVVVFSW